MRSRASTDGPAGAKLYDDGRPETAIVPVQSFGGKPLYRLAHPEVGTHDIFLVPIARKAEGLEYEAIFT